MILYHFTCYEHADAIEREGITRGDVPISQTDGFSAPWLTRNALSDAQGWQGKPLLVTPNNISAFRAAQNSPPDLKVGDVIPVADKGAVRFTVKVPRGDRKLKHWPAFAKKRLTADWYATLDSAGGGGSRDWYIYRGVIPPEWIVERANIRNAEPSQ